VGREFPFSKETCHKQKQEEGLTFSAKQRKRRPKGAKKMKEGQKQKLKTHLSNESAAGLAFAGRFHH
jgi:hypothetical protein